MSNMEFQITSRSIAFQQHVLADSIWNIHILSLEEWSFVIPKSRFVALLLQWCYMKVMPFKITSFSTGFQQHALAVNKENIQTLALET